MNKKFPNCTDDTDPSFIQPLGRALNSTDKIIIGDCTDPAECLKQINVSDLLTDGDIELTATPDDLPNIPLNSDGSAVDGSLPAADFGLGIEVTHEGSSGNAQSDDIVVPCWGEGRQGVVELNTRDEVRKDPLPYHQVFGDAAGPPFIQAPDVFTSSQLLDDKRGMSLRKTFQAVDSWHYIRVNATYSIGAGGEFNTLREAFAWVEDKRIVGQVSVVFSLLAGDHVADAVDFSHPDAHKIALRGQAAGATPVIADMTGNVATDEAFVRSIYPSRLLLDDTNLGIGGYGLHLSDGLADITDIAIISNARYSITTGGFAISYQSPNSRASLSLDNVTFFGGVWGMLNIDTHIANKSQIFFAHQQADGASPAGGAFLMRSGSFISNLPVNQIEAYVPGATTFFYGVDSDIDLANSSAAHGMSTVVQLENAQANIIGGTFTGGGQLCQLHEESSLSASDVSLDDFDTARNLNPSEVFPGYGLGTWRTNMFISYGSRLTIRNLSITNSTATYWFWTDGGYLYGFGISIDNCNWTSALQGLGNNTAGVVRLQGAITNTIFSDNVLTDGGGESDISGMAGVSSSPAIGTFTNAARVR